MWSGASFVNMIGTSAGVDSEPLESEGSRRDAVTLAHGREAAMQRDLLLVAMRGLMTAVNGVRRGLACHAAYRLEVR